MAAMLSRPECVKDNKVLPASQIGTPRGCLGAQTKMGTEYRENKLVWNTDNEKTELISINTQKLLIIKCKHLNHSPKS